MFSIVISVLIILIFNLFLFWRQFNLATFWNCKRVLSLESFLYILYLQLLYKSYCSLKRKWVLIFNIWYLLNSFDYFEVLIYIFSWVLVHIVLLWLLLVCLHFVFLCFTKFVCVFLSLVCFNVLTNINLKVLKWQNYKIWLPRRNIFCGTPWRDKKFIELMTISVLEREVGWYSWSHFEQLSITVTKLGWFDSWWCFGW